MEVICLEEPAFYKLVETVVERLKDQHHIKEELWLSGEEAMQKLKISGKTTLFKIIWRIVATKRTTTKYYYQLFNISYGT